MSQNLAAPSGGRRQEARFSPVSRNQKIGTTCSLRDIMHFKILHSLSLQSLQTHYKADKRQGQGGEPGEATKCRVPASHR